MAWVRMYLEDHLVPNPLPCTVTSSTRRGCSEPHQSDLEHFHGCAILDILDILAFWTFNLRERNKWRKMTRDSEQHWEERKIYAISNTKRENNNKENNN